MNVDQNEVSQAEGEVAIWPKCLCILSSTWILFLAGSALGQLRADIEPDNVVNFKDLAVLAKEWLQDSNEASLKAKNESSFPSLGIVRDSVAYDADYREIPEHVGRYEEICIASRPQVSVNTNLVRQALAVDGDLVICDDYYSVYTTTDGVNFTRLFVLSTDEDFVGYYDANDYPRSVEVMSDGSWLFSFGAGTSGGPGTRGHLFRSVDKGLTWTHVLEFESGFVPDWGWAISGNEVAIGEYGCLHQENNPRRIYYSDDLGVTWSKIYEPESDPRSHVHLVAFPPGNTNVLYVSTGDYDENNRVDKVEYIPGAGGKRNIANWFKTANSPILERQNCPTAAISDGRYLYLGHDGYISPVIWRLDPEDDSVVPVLDWPLYNDNLNHPYISYNPHAMIFSMLKHEGVFYVAVRGVEEYRGGGIYVSTDAEHWTCAYRVEGVEGFHNLVGFAGGYLWGTFWDNTARRLYKMTPLRADVVTGMSIDRGITNQLGTPESSSFEGGDGGWIPRTAYEDINEVVSGVSTDMALHGNSSYKIVIEDKVYRYGAHLCSNFCPVNPKNGDYICASFWARAGADRPTGYLGFARIEVVGGGSIDTEESWFNLCRNQGWEKVTVWGRCLNDSFTDGMRIWLGLCDVYHGGDYSGCTCYVDCAQVVYFPDLHYSGSWQIGGSPRANEVARGSLVGLGAEFTTTFEWKPERSRREWHDNVYIASWTDTQEYVDLYYDHINSKFVATDGTNMAVTTQVFSWDHPDNVKFAFTNMDGDFRLSVLTPLNGVEHVLTDNSDTKLRSPVAITFGTDSQRTNYGCGLIAHVKHFDSALTASQIQQLFDLVEPTSK